MSMWGPWRLTLRKAEHALKLGRLDEAQGYVTRPELRSFRQGRELAVRVAEALACRAEEHLKHGDSPRAWCDIEQAASLAGAEQRVGQVRQELVRREIEEAAQYLRAAQPATALETLVRLAHRGVNSPDASRLNQAAQAWHAAIPLVRHGRFADALLQYEKAKNLWQGCESLELAIQQAHAGRDRIIPLETALHRTLETKDWSTALAVADEILSIAPDHVQARAARRQAWRAVGAPVSAIPGGKNAVIDSPHRAHGDAITLVQPPGSLPSSAGANDSELSAPPASDQRFLLWIDGVGGYLVCLANRVSLGQPAGWHVDVPIMADLSRLHAWIERDGEGYLVRAGRSASVNGTPVRDQMVLRDQSLILLGNGTRLRFRLPCPLSATARLDIESPHRLALAADAVLLMADTCIIGFQSHCHVVAPNWKCELVIYRQGTELWCRTRGSFEVDGQTVQDRSALTKASRVRGDGFSLALEPVPPSAGGPIRQARVT